MIPAASAGVRSTPASPVAVFGHRTRACGVPKGETGPLRDLPCGGVRVCRANARPRCVSEASRVRNVALGRAMEAR